jgi:hypothetical protein
MFKIVDVMFMKRNFTEQREFILKWTTIFFKEYLYKYLGVWNVNVLYLRLAMIRWMYLFCLLYSREGFACLCFFVLVSHLHVIHALLGDITSQSVAFSRI